MEAVQKLILVMLPAQSLRQREFHKYNLVILFLLVLIYNHYNYQITLTKASGEENTCVPNCWNLKNGKIGAGEDYKK